MLKKIYFKIFLFVVLSSFLVLTVSSLISSISLSFFYYEQIEDNIKNVTESDFIGSVNNILLSDMDDNLKYKAMEDILYSYKGNLEINENRSIYILKEDNLSVVVPVSKKNENIYVSQNILSSSLGTDNRLHFFEDFIDYAYSFKTINGDKYVLYLKDNKSELRSQLINNLTNYVWVFLLSVLIALAISFFISRKITVPLKKITRRAEGLERGELTENLDDIECTEFKELTEAVNHMGFVMAESIRHMNSDKHKVEVILEHINNGIITFDVNQKPIQINSAAKRILKLKEDEKIAFDDFFKNLGIDICMAEFSYLDKSKTIEKEIKKDEGYIKTWFIPFKMDSERNAGVVCVFEDITDQFNVMEAMKKFVADVSHELKTPITVISSYTETVLNSYIDDKAMASNLLNIVYQEAGKMTELVQNLLDISKYETNAMNSKMEPFSVDEMIISLVKTFKLEAEKKKLQLTYNRMTDIPEFKGSRSDIERAIKNIISNSIKYTSRGDKINIFAGRMHNDIYIKIEDTGWGIPENKLGHLFERFYRVEDEARSRDKGGTGLGLSIAKEIIEKHKGKIKIESEYTKYTKVTITLPIKKDKEG